jgi:hypothetical protein
MKPRHAAALALVGWYLLVPPPKSLCNQTADLHAPLSKWVTVEKYASAGTCSEGLSDDRYLAQHPRSSAFASKVFAYGRCIASDDPHLNPRLKEK